MKGAFRTPLPGCGLRLTSLRDVTATDGETEARDELRCLGGRELPESISSAAGPPSCSGTKWLHNEASAGDMVTAELLLRLFILTIAPVLLR